MAVAQSSGNRRLRATSYETLLSHPQLPHETQHACSGAITRATCCPRTMLFEVGRDAAIEPCRADTAGLPNDDRAPPGSPGPAPSSIAFRMRLVHCTGPNAMHCHALVHEENRRPRNNCK